jgi:hypothetical protein
MGISATVFVAVMLVLLLIVQWELVDSYHISQAHTIGRGISFHSRMFKLYNSKDGDGAVKPKRVKVGAKAKRKANIRKLYETWKQISDDQK